MQIILNIHVGRHVLFLKVSTISTCAGNVQTCPPAHHQISICNKLPPQSNPPIDNITHCSATGSNGPAAAVRTPHGKTAWLQCQACKQGCPQKGK